MICRQVQSELSLYLYGELDFAREDAVERHLEECAFCDRALVREKAWHASINSGVQDYPRELVDQCRLDLKANLSRTNIDQTEDKVFPKLGWRDRFFLVLGISASPWSIRLAVASSLLILGFGAGGWVERNGLPGVTQPGNSTEMSLFGPNTRVRDVRPSENGKVRIFIDQVRQGEVVVSLDDTRVRQLLLAASQDPDDPAVRVDSVEILESQRGNDVRDALIATAYGDPNTAVRLTALEGLKNFTDDPNTQQALKYVLETDLDAGVRSEAIDILAPVNDKVEFNPYLAGMLEDIVRSDQSDDYIRLRCLQVLGQMQASLGTY